ncbi:3'(2'),5'-bisphosphate nucleotidase CysQ [Beijerinckia sp. L45]|uniref:3'(2'),5'-bisphosphate nucleotidase CysQ n=1 Tax=Beijerinckia sp. L45 TaxID=1641855 RepID=UPI001FEDB5D0|nr:3'(2'),5'-bisphosphate nucleotidase CysQ [Beijerinckia sp. L45]
MTPNDLATLPRLQAIVAEAGAIGRGYFRAGDQTDAKVTWKGDGSPVTEADFAVNAFLETQLRALWPDAAWLSEESVDNPARLGAARVIIVDPIDGTRGFARGDSNWCVAVALVEHGRPVLGIVHAPVIAETYVAALGQGATLNDVALRVGDRTALRPDMRISAPMSLADAMRKAGVELDFRPKIASLALRITNVAACRYDCCFATKDSNDWDLAAADLILQESGGILAGIDGQPLVYNRMDTRHGVLTATARRLQPAFLEAITRTNMARR